MRAAKNVFCEENTDIYYYSRVQVVYVGSGSIGTKKCLLTLANKLNPPNRHDLFENKTMMTNEAKRPSRTMKVFFCREEIQTSTTSRVRTCCQ